MLLTRLQWNIVANFVGRTWSALATFVFVPFYLRFMGAESYGLVAGYSMLLTVFSFTNFGLRAALSRELARLSGRRDSIREMRDVVRTFELIFWGLAIALAVIVILTSQWIANRWVSAEGLPDGEVSRAIRLMGLAMSFQFPYIFYEGGLVGLQRQFLTNGIWIVTGVFRGVGSVLVLWLVSPTAHAFLLWQVVLNLAQAVFTGAALWRSLSGPSESPKFRSFHLAENWSYIAGNTLISVNGVALTQVDKLAVSRLLTLETFGVYSIASLISQLPSMIAGPILTAVFPGMTQHSDARAEQPLARLYHRACQLVSVATLPVAAIVAMFPRELINLWTGDPDLAGRTAQLVTLLVVGGTCQTLQMVPMNLALSHGWTRLNVVTGLVSTLLIVPLAVLLVQRYGATGAAAAWCLLNAGILLAYPVALHKRYLRAELAGWWMRDIFPPLCGSVVTVALARLMMDASISRFYLMVVLACVWLVATIAAAALSPHVREELKRIVTSSKSTRHD